MVVYPLNWKEKGQPIKTQDIEETVLLVLKEIDINCLALSGGLDSSLMLYFMTKVYGIDIDTFTIALSEDHPDYIYSKTVSKHFGVKWNTHIPTESLERKETDCPGDEIVRDFFRFIESKGVDKIICCDGIDEYMCGYYGHRDDPSEETYFNYIRQLQEYHLEPLHKNSGRVKVFLPYLDDCLISLLSQIPIADKVDTKNRKKIMIEMAKGKLPDEIIQRPKYGFCDAMKIK